MRILLTGSSGFLGSRILHYLLKQDHTLSCIPSDMLKGEITGERMFPLVRHMEVFNPDVVIHTAAISSTAYSEQNPAEAYIANVKLPVVMAKLTARNKSKFIFCSSDQVYSACYGTEPNSETTDSLAPINVYGRHKLEAERRLSELCPDTVSLRLSWMYDMPVYRTKSNNNFVLSLMKSAMTGIPLAYSICDFRGLTFARTVAENLPKTFTLPGGVYNFGSENDMNMYDTACGFMTAMGLTNRISELIKSVSAHPPRNLLMDCSKIREHGINIEPTAKGIERLVGDYPGLF